MLRVREGKGQAGGETGGREEARGDGGYRAALRKGGP